MKHYTVLKNYVPESGQGCKMDRVNDSTWKHIIKITSGDGVAIPRVVVFSVL